MCTLWNVQANSQTSFGVTFACIQNIGTCSPTVTTHVGQFCSAQRQLRWSHFWDLGHFANVRLANIWNNAAHMYNMPRISCYYTWLYVIQGGKGKGHAGLGQGTRGQGRKWGRGGEARDGPRGRPGRDGRLAGGRGAKGALDGKARGGQKGQVEGRANNLFVALVCCLFATRVA